MPAALEGSWLTVFHRHINKIEWNEQRAKGSACSPLSLLFYVLFFRLLFTIHHPFSLSLSHRWSLLDLFLITKLLLLSPFPTLFTGLHFLSCILFLPSCYQSPCQINVRCRNCFRMPQNSVLCVTLLVLLSTIRYVFFKKTAAKGHKYNLKMHVTFLKVIKHL